MPRPSLSVVIPTRNYGHYLRACLDAMRSQSMLPDEILVVDDASSDETPTIVDEARRCDSRIRLLRLEHHVGLIAACEQGLTHTHGEYLYFGAADDVVTPELFAASVPMLTAHPDAGLCCSDPVYFDDDTGRRWSQPLGWSSNPRYFSPGEIAHVIDGRDIAGHTVVVRRSAFLEAGGWLESLKWHTDWFAWLAIAFRRGVCYVPRLLATCRAHQASYSAKSRRDARTMYAIFDALLALLQSEGYRDLLPYFIRGDVLNHQGRDLVRWLVGDGRRDETTLALARRPVRTWAAREGALDLARDTALASAAWEAKAGRWRTALREVAREAARQPDDVALRAKMAEIASRLQRDGPADDADDPAGYDHVRTVAIFGAGEHGERASELARRCGWEVVCFLDNAVDGRQQTLAGRPIVAPATLKHGEVDMLIVASDDSRDDMFAQAETLGYRPGDEVVWFRQPFVVGGIRFTVD
jgi:glycosyltransferase involved in cell wall biosynthesis